MDRHELKEKISELSHNGQYVVATPLMEEYCEMIATEYGKDSDRYVTVINDLGGMYRNIGDWDKAESTFNRALEIVEGRLGIRSVQYATITVNLACMYRFLKQFEKAEKLFLNAIEIYDEDSDFKITKVPDRCDCNPNVLKEKTDFIANAIEMSTLYANACNNIGVLYQDMKQFDKAIEYHSKSLSLLRTTNNYEYLAITLNNFVNPYMQMKEFDKAIEVVNESLSILKEHVSTEHPFYLTALNNLGTIYYSQNKLYEALECFVEAKTHLVTSFGENSPQYESCLKNIAVVEEKIKNGVK